MELDNQPYVTLNFSDKIFRVKSFYSENYNYPKDSIKLHDSVNDNNFVSEISVFNSNDFSIYKHVIIKWANNYEENSLTLLYIPEKSYLFISAGYVTFIVDLENERLVEEYYNRFNVISLIRISNKILQIGELDYFIFDIAGKLLKEISVDASARYDLQNDKLKIISDSTGEFVIDL